LGCAAGLDDRATLGRADAIGRALKEDVMTRMTARPVLAVALAALALAGCSRSDREEAAPANDVTVTEVPVPEPSMEPLPAPSPTAEVNMAEPLPEAEPEAPDAQMLDDASATGMTARADRGNDDEAPANRE
jgi:PBP1b-binding outer membrane lipoprotein LpoB